MSVAPIIQFIGTSATGDQVACRVRPLLDDLLSQYEDFQPPPGYPIKEKVPLPVICTSQEKTPPKTRYQCLKNEWLTLLYGSQSDLDFADARAAILANMDANAFLLTLSMDHAPVKVPVKENECVILPYHSEGAFETLALLIEVFVAWNMFPTMVGLDWGDLKAFMGGNKKSLAVFRSESADYKKNLSNGLRLLAQS